MKVLIKNLRLFGQGALLAYVALFHWLRPSQYVASKIIMPLAQMFFFVYLGTFASGPGAASFYIIGNSIQVAAISGIFGVTMSIGGERDAGTLPYLFGTPANRLTIFLGRASMNILDGGFNVVIAFAWGVVLLGLDLSHTDLAALALTILVTTVSTCGLGLLLGSLSLVTAQVMFVNNFVYFLLLIFSGANVPIQELPAWMQVISEALPLTRGIAAGRLLVGGSSLASVAPLLMTELGVGLAYGFLGYLFFQLFEVEARRRGTLEIL